MHFYLYFDPQIGSKLDRTRKASAWWVLLGGQEGPGSSPGTILDSPERLQGAPEILKKLQKASKRLARESKGSQEAPKGFQGPL